MKCAFNRQFLIGYSFANIKFFFVENIQNESFIYKSPLVMQTTCSERTDWRNDTGSKQKVGKTIRYRKSSRVASERRFWSFVLGV